MDRKDCFKMYVNEIFSGYCSKWQFDFKSNETSVYMFGPNDEQIEIEYNGITKISYEKDSSFGSISIKTKYVLINIDFIS